MLPERYLTIPVRESGAQGHGRHIRMNRASRGAQAARGAT